MKLALSLSSPLVKSLSNKVTQILPGKYKHIEGRLLETFAFTLVNHPKAGRYRGVFIGVNRKNSLSEYDDEKNKMIVALAFLSNHCSKVEPKPKEQEDG
ncbi:MAG: hypothetical protein ABW007_19220 [Chitinophagaceae bacterium]